MLCPEATGTARRAPTKIFSLSMVLTREHEGLAKNALQKSTNHALEERLLLTRQIAAHLDFALDSSLNWMEESFNLYQITPESSPGHLTTAINKVRASSPFPLSSISLATLNGRLLITVPPVPASQSMLEINHALLGEMLLDGKSVISSAAEISADNRMVVYLLIPVRVESREIVGAVQATIDPFSPSADWVTNWTTSSDICI